ncbi:hypothetical protein J3Q64DRAFT_1864649 [Phycomyces blakesleeanus]|uniref:Uncharacterized protein n=2 Tax=Phycomyces blakesleeanus TaxID=4837 RepID=A0A162U233_PHYB8|nr:hypothetical protein PHYBLDRAFT_146185 [Phycomyces blakesleeanus NRRL 1555(-)]OAD72862.1 hypothetical protein PHYBLDRAFT_146185 [Phycomyces blakesleeanus NRRL 1555(-)]|eukprot:XP_018290902.1 hypothetical protein PHYBLDRAFT_146185 [Phycomyces blakesleeanus NRRL 1555(-)]
MVDLPGVLLFWKDPERLIDLILLQPDRPESFYFPTRDILPDIKGDSSKELLETTYGKLSLYLTLRFSSIQFSFTAAILSEKRKRIEGDRMKLNVYSNFASLIHGSPLLESHFACARVLADAILLNVSSSVAIMINTIEVLITLSIHINIPEDPKIGPLSSTITILPQTSNIYVDQGSWEKAVALALNSKASSIHISYLIGQMKQLHVQFHYPTSYILFYASSHVAMWCFCQPLTVFTYADFEGIKKSIDNDNSSMIASQMFQEICYEVINFPTTAKLNKALVVNSVAELNNSKIKILFNSLLTLFGDNDNIPILQHRDLNHVMQ